jgi:hypothetical protein
MILLLSLGVVVFLSLAALSTRASGATLYVSNNPGCAGKTPCYNTIQAAADAASSGDEIRIAAGTYSGTQNRTGTDGYNYKQVVFIEKSLTVRGGYHPTTWTGPSPEDTPTVIDAMRQGRGVTVLGNGTQSVTLDSLTIQGGDYTDLGNPPGVSNQACAGNGSDCGGGLFAHAVQIILKNSIVRDNIGTTKNASEGGGIYLWYAEAGSRIENTLISDNVLGGVQGFGGGLHVKFGYALTIEKTTFFQNSTNGTGGGLFLYQVNDEVQMEDCDFIENTAEEYAGGISIGATYNGDVVTIKRTTFQDNYAQFNGAAIELDKWGSKASNVRMHNLIFSGNTLGSTPPGAAAFYIEGGSGAQLAVELKHLTFANHPGLSALYVHQNYNQLVDVDLTNTLIDDAANAFSALEDNGTVDIIHDYSLVHNVATVNNSLGGTPSIVTSHLVNGDPKLTSTYHLGFGSQAVDAGIDAGVSDDIDGEQRPLENGFDIGADESRNRVDIFLPLVVNH